MRRDGRDRRRRDRGHRPGHRRGAEPGTALPLAIWVEVAGRKMQPDFEPILERQIHHLVNGAEGIWHMGQRDIVWTRVSKSGFAKGLRLRHYGEILHAKLLSRLPGHRGQGQGHADHRPGRGRAAPGRRPQGLRRAQPPAGVDDRRVGGHLLLLPAVPVLRAQPRLHHHAGAAGPVRRLQLAGRQGRLRDRRDRPQPAGQEGRMPRPGAAASGRASTSTSIRTATRPSTASAPTPSWTSP